MRLIVGLGNPGKKYDSTRHNFGFMVLDKIVEKGGFSPFRLENQFQAEISQTNGVGENRVIFAKPMTFMNNSGDAVQKLTKYFRLGVDDLIVIYDDIDLDMGVIRVRFEGTSGGHQGIESIIKNFKDNHFIRIRLGIGSNKDKNIPSERYVLEKFGKNEQTKVSLVIDKIADLVLNWSKSGDFEIQEETLNIA